MRRSFTFHVFAFIAAISLCVSFVPTANAAPSVACQTPDASEVRIKGGGFLMGAGRNDMDDDDVVERKVTVAGFSIDKFAVTNSQFAAFVAATSYVTDAEKAPNPADFPDVSKDKLVAGSAVFAQPATDSGTSDELAWWKFVPGADWRHPAGPGSDIVGKDNYPVVHVSYNDALAYAKWRRRDLPTEQQFEYAARGGLDGKTYVWGDEMAPGGRAMANTWQGHFPTENTKADGFEGLAPVGCFPANGYGLYDMAGNTWEWTKTLGRNAPATATSRVMRILKGGSFLCSENFCRRYRPAAHQGFDSGFSAMHVGFRTVGRS